GPSSRVEPPQQRAPLPRRPVAHSVGRPRAGGRLAWRRMGLVYSRSTMTILDELRWRGLLADCTDLDALTKRLSEGPITLYAGFDPTADSLHVGNLVPLFALRRFQLRGHHPIALAGGSTGMIGDPSGKPDERNLLTP